MTSDSSGEFAIDYEEELRSADQFLRGRRARTRIRIFADSVCITDPEGSYTVSDFLPHNCTKLLRGVGTLVSGDSHRVPFTDSVCDVHFRPTGEGTTLVNAYSGDGTLRNPEVPDDGIPVATSAVIEEIIATSTEVRDRFEAIPEFEPGEEYQEFLDALDAAQKTRGEM